MNTDALVTYRRELSIGVVLIFAAVLAWMLTPLLPPVTQPDAGMEAVFHADDGYLFRQEQVVYPMRGSGVAPQGQNISIGVATDQGELNFGRTPVNGSTIKTVDISTPRKTLVNTYRYGNITRFLQVSSPGVVTGATSVRATFAPTETGNFTGVLVVESVIPQNRVATSLLSVME